MQYNRKHLYYSLNFLPQSLTPNSNFLIKNPLFKNTLLRIVFWTIEGCLGEQNEKMPAQRKRW